MNEDDFGLSSKNKPIDLSSLSISELEARIIFLKEEILRAENLIKSKQSSLDAANLLFGNKKQ